jgi:hypothetical protein
VRCFDLSYSLHLRDLSGECEFPLNSQTTIRPPNTRASHSVTPETPAPETLAGLALYQLYGEESMILSFDFGDYKITYGKKNATTYQKW